jgi:hypothetical protein
VTLWQVHMLMDQLCRVDQVCTVEGAGACLDKAAPMLLVCSCCTHVGVRTVHAAPDVAGWYSRLALRVCTRHTSLTSGRTVCSSMGE